MHITRSGMSFVKNIFWNSSQKRSRSAFRIIVLFILYFGFSGVMASALVSISSYNLSSEAPLWFFILYALLLLVAAFLSSWLSGRFLDQRPYVKFGLNLKGSWWFDFAFGFVLGIFLMGLIFITQVSLGWITIHDTFYRLDANLSFILPLLVFFFLFICVAISEELVTRGYLLKNLSEGLNFKSTGPKKAIYAAWIISSVVFGILHLENPNATYISSLNIMMAGILLGYGYVLTGELSIAIGLHLSWNFFQGNVFGFPVSGLTMPAKVVTIFKIEQGGPEFWTGGVFGPEAGFLGLLAMFLGVVLIYGWVRWRSRPAESGIFLDLAKHT